MINFCAKKWTAIVYAFYWVMFLREIREQVVPSNEGKLALFDVLWAAGVMPQRSRSCLQR